MAELLVKAVSARHADPEKDRAGCYKKGDLVVAMPDGHGWGAKERQPRFVVVKVPGVTVAQVEDYCRSWRRVLDISVISENPASGVYQATVACTNPGASGLANITREQVEAYLNRWGAVVDAIGTSSVTFTLDLWETLKSRGFWQADASLVGFTLVTYADGTATVDVNISGVLAYWTPAQIARTVQERGGTVIGYSAPVGRFSIHRSTVLEAFIEDVKRQMENIFVRRQYYFTEADVDAALAAGGTVTLTAAQVVARIGSKLDE